MKRLMVSWTAAWSVAVAVILVLGLARAVCGEGAPRADASGGFTVFVRDVEIPADVFEIVASDTGFTQISADTTIRVAFAADSKFDSVASGNAGYGTLTAVWSGASTADESVNNNFFQNVSGTGTVTANISGAFSRAFSARSGAHLVRREDTDFRTTSNASFSMAIGRFASGNPSATEIAFSVYESPDIVQLGFDANGNFFGRVSDDGRATWDSVGVTADVADSNYHFISFHLVDSATDSIRLHVDNNTAVATNISNATLAQTTDTVMVFEFRGASSCRCRASEIFFAEDAVTMNADLRQFGWRALRESNSQSTDSFFVHVAGVGTDSAHVDTAMKVAVRTPGVTSRRWHAFETAYLDTNEALPILAFTSANSPRSSLLDSIPAGRLDFDIAQVLIGDNERGLSVLEEVEFRHESVSDTILWQLRIYPTIEDTRDLGAGYFLRTARTHTNEPVAKIVLDYPLAPASFVNVYAAGAAGTDSGSVLLRGRRR